MNRSYTNRQIMRLAIAGAFALASTVTIATTAHAQMTPVAPPQITVSARGDEQVAPDRARVQLGVQTQAKTAALAAQENNKKQTAILNAIRALGVAAAQITTLNYSVAPNQRYDAKLQRVVIDGYTVSNVVQVESDKLEQAGPIIDAALANGANQVNSLDFIVKDPSKARDAALTKAVESARRQAEVAAKAAGGALGDLLEINISEFERPEPRPMLAMMAKREVADAAPTPLSEGLSTVSVTVSTRWKFNR
jgi:uncharacterized protein